MSRNRDNETRRPHPSQTRYHHITEVTNTVTGEVYYEARAGGKQAGGKSQQQRRTLKELCEWRDEQLTAAKVTAPRAKVTNANVTVDEASARFIVVRSTNGITGERTWDKDRGSLQYLTMAGYGDKRVGKLTTDDVRDVINRGLMGEFAHRGGSGNWVTSTANTFINAIHLMLDQAVADKCAATNVSRIIHRRSEADSDEQADRVYDTFNEEEYSTVLAAAAKDDLAAAWWLGLHRGLRRGEICGLRWPQVDFGRLEFTVSRSRVSSSGRVIDKGTKNRKPRTIPMDKALATILWRTRKKQEDNRKAMGAAYDHEDDLVIVNPAGRGFHPDTVTDLWYDLLERTGIKRIRLHDARHTFASISLDRKMNPVELSHTLGHHSTAYTLKVYAHSHPERQVDAMNLLNDLADSAVGDLETFPGAHEGHTTTPLHVTKPGKTASQGLTSNDASSVA